MISRDFMAIISLFRPFWVLIPHNYFNYHPSMWRDNKFAVYLAFDRANDDFEDENMLII